jgi:hypothetical protein
MPRIILQVIFRLAGRKMTCKRLKYHAAAGYSAFELSSIALTALVEQAIIAIFPKLPGRCIEKVG